MQNKRYYEIKGVSYYIYKYREDHGLPFTEKDDWGLAEFFINQYSDEYHQAGDEFLQVWLDNKFKEDYE